MSVDVINEGSSKRLTLDLLDENGSPAVPNAVTYRIDCLTSGDEIRDTTSLSPAGSIEIPLTPEDTAISDPGNPSERRRVTVIATFAAGEKLTSEYDYRVKNLSGYPDP